MLPDFDADGCLPAGDYELTLAELRASILVQGPAGGYPNWDRGWRSKLVNNVQVLAQQLWQVGVTEIFVDGSFVEDKEHPNDIDGYFVCDLRELASGRLQSALNLLDPHKVWTWDPASRRPYRGYPKKQLPMWHHYRVEMYPHYVPALGHPRQIWKRTRVPVGISPLTPRRTPQRNREDQERRPAMIRNESEYQEAVRRLQEERARLNDHKAHLEGMGLDPDEVKRAIDPLRSFHDQLGEEVESYERLKRGDIAEMMNLHGLGHALVALRIALGLTQRELASRLGVHESQVSRDERNEYHNITVDRASRILDALGVRMRSLFEQPLAPPMPDPSPDDRIAATG